VLQWVEQEALERQVLRSLEAVRYLLQAVEQGALEEEQVDRLVFLVLQYLWLVSLVISHHGYMVLKELEDEGWQ
jgi:hypothetical protein